MFPESYESTSTSRQGNNRRLYEFFDTKGTTGGRRTTKHATQTHELQQYWMTVAVTDLKVRMFQQSASQSYLGHL